YADVTGLPDSCVSLSDFRFVADSMLVESFTVDDVPVGELVLGPDWADETKDLVMANDEAEYRVYRAGVLRDPDLEHATVVLWLTSRYHASISDLVFDAASERVQDREEESLVDAVTLVPARLGHFQPTYAAVRLATDGSGFLYVCASRAEVGGDGAETLGAPNCNWISFGIFR
ncbi:MAG TPA: hypothetical protein VEP72_08535, partial [Microbacterium sp.]|nr:hypothetical protein [Microbacterium sp.]